MKKWILIMAAAWAIFPAYPQKTGIISPLGEQPVRKSFKSLPNPDRILHTAQDLEDNDFWASALDDGKKSKTVVFHFKNISTGFELSFKDNTRMMAILDSIFSDITILNQVEYIAFTGASSPDGYTDRNEKLAAERAKVIRNYILRKYPHIDRNRLRSFSAGQYWDGLLQLVEKDRAMPSRDASLRILKSSQTGEVKRKQLQQLNSRKTYNYLLKNTFPHLRVCAVQIIFYEGGTYVDRDVFVEEVETEVVEPERVIVSRERETRQAVVPRERETVVPRERETRQAVVPEGTKYTVIPEPGTKYTVIPDRGEEFTVIPETGTKYTVIKKAGTETVGVEERVQPRREVQVEERTSPLPPSKGERVQPRREVQPEERVQPRREVRPEEQTSPWPPSKGERVQPRREVQPEERVTERVQPRREVRPEERTDYKSARAGERTFPERTPSRTFPEPKEKIRKEGMLFAVKSNLLFDALTAVNFELELPIENNFSIAGEYIFPWWLLKNKQYCLQLIAGNLEMRYWAGERTGRDKLTGLFGGVFVGGGYYDLGFGDKGYQGEINLMAGLSGGYTHPISKDGKWRMEYSMGLGYMSTDYREYKPVLGIDDKWHLILQSSGRQSYFGPLRAKVSIVRTINRK